MDKVLVVDSSQDSFQLIKKSLDSRYELYWSKSYEETSHCISENYFDLFLLNTALPDRSGFELCQLIRNNEKFDHTPIIFITNQNDISDKVLGFSMGADDYISSPYDPRELLARISSKLRKKHKEEVSTEQIQIGNILVNRSSQTVTFSEKPDDRVELTPIEFKILYLFIKSPEQILSRDDILKSVWGESIYVYTRSVDTHVSKLRKKLRDYSDYIQSVHGSGYRFHITQQSSCKCRAH